MKKIIFLILFFLVFRGIAQRTYSSKITYRANFHSDLLLSNITELVYDKSASFFLYGDDIIGDNDEEIKIITYKNDFHEVLYTDLENNLIFDELELFEKPVLVKEEITKIPWEIDYETTETILGYKCYKAEALFRGRYYIAWFTMEIPVKFGPWKLNGLPGLILEAYDKYNKVEFIVEQVQNFEAPIPFEYNLNDKKKELEIVELKYYADNIDKHIRNKIDVLISKFPRESKVSNLKISKYRGKELKYEWEKETNNE